MVSDMSPGLVKPLVYSTKTVGMAENVFGRMFTELIGPNDIDFSALAKRIHSRIYTDLTMLGELFERVGMPTNFFHMISRDEQTEFRRPPITPGTLGAMFRLLRFAWNHSRPKDGIDALIQRHDRALEPYRRADWVSTEPGQLLAQFDRLLHVHGETQWSILIGSMNMAVRNRLLNRMVSRQAEDVVPSDLIRGLVGLKALEPNAELRDMASGARDLSELDRCVLSEQDAPAIRATLSGSEHGRALVRRMDAFLNRYGFLSANGTDFSGTPWCEDPALLWHSVGRLVASPNFFAVKDVEAVREETRIRVRAQLNWMQRQFFDRLLASTITYVDVRERTSFLMSEETYEMRRILLALGNHLAASGVLRERDDVFYLTYDELRNLVETNPEVAVVQDLVDGRKAEMAADAQLELPDTLCGDHVLAQPILLADEQEYLVGISGSSGLAQGHACVVLDPTQAPASLDRDMILVVPFTDVGWTPLFAGIGGIVAETGGQLSHTSIVAREYGLPAVVSIRGATQLIRDGQPLLVDGDRGRVYLRHLLDS
jgi:pyruvate,water dikinase